MAPRLPCRAGTEHVALAARLHRRSIALSVLSVAVDRASDGRLIPRMLTAVAGLALRLVLTVTLMMVQLAMSDVSTYGTD